MVGAGWRFFNCWLCQSPGSTLVIRMVTNGSKKGPCGERIEPAPDESFGGQMSTALLVALMLVILGIDHSVGGVSDSECLHPRRFKILGRANCLSE